MSEFKQVSPRTWVRALKSGKYKRATDSLRDDDGMCCLGVYADLCGWDEHWFNHEDEGDPECWSYRDLLARRALPDWMSFTSMENLSNANDNVPVDEDSGWASTRVIEYIERHLVPAYDRRKATTSSV